MKSQLELYSFISAKLKTKLNKFLSSESLEGAIQAKTLVECFLPFRGTPYEVLERVYASTGDLKMVEAQIFVIQISAYLDVLKFVEDPVFAFVRALARGMEIEHIKNTIRLWFDAHVRGRSIDDRTVYCYRGTFIDAFNTDRVIGAQNAEAVIEEFRNTDYYAIIKNELHKSAKLGTLFSLETALDKQYYTLLTQACQKLSKHDIEVAEKFISLDVDIENIASLVRLGSFTNLHSDEITQYLIDYKGAMSVSALASAYTGDNVSAVALSLLGKKYAGLASLWSRGDMGMKLAGLERVLHELRTMEARRFLAGNPFSIGIIIAYFILLENELTAVRTVLNAKYYGLPEDRIRSIV